MSTKASFLLTLLLLFSLSCADDQLAPPLITTDEFSIIAELPGSIKESSGIFYSDAGFLWTHNDSGDASIIYNIDLNQGSVVKTLNLENVEHVDWESVTQDDEHVYIGDIGNNNGTRTDLAIHKFPTVALQNNDSVAVSTITFTYADQNDFSSKEKHNFDCEAMIPLDDQLFLFTKNRANLETNIYTVSKDPGTYILEQANNFAVDGFITAAAINKQSTRICLLGYDINEPPFKPFIWLISDFQGSDFLNGKLRRINLDLSVQTEAICFVHDDLIYFTSEAESGRAAFVYALDLSKWW
ncbi:MAG: hypothetical protein ACI8YQ_001221 [Polaribacter sp.]|jgi:hypothetical protein